MIKFLRECFKDYHAAKQDLAEIGIWHMPTILGVFTYIDESTYREHLKSKIDNSRKDID